MSLGAVGGGSQEQLNQAVEQLYQWEDLWSATDEDSEIWAADHSGGEWVTLSGIRWIFSPRRWTCAA